MLPDALWKVALLLPLTVWREAVRNDDNNNKNNSVRLLSLNQSVKFFLPLSCKRADGVLSSPCQVDPSLWMQCRISQLIPQMHLLKISDKFESTRRLKGWHLHSLVSWKKKKLYIFFNILPFCPILVSYRCRQMFQGICGVPAKSQHLPCLKKPSTRTSPLFRIHVKSRLMFATVGVI